MALNAGSVALDGSGNPTGSGLARAIYDSYLAAYYARFPAFNPLPLGSLHMLADLAEGFAGPIVAHIVANAVVHAGTLAAHVTSESLGRTPSPNNPNTAIQAPSAAVDVPLTGAGTVT